MATTIDPLLFPSMTVRSNSGRSVRPAVSQRTFQRRRMAVGAVLVFGLASAFISTGAFASDPESSQQSAPRTVIAKSGDTLWDIAHRLVPNGNITAMVDELVQLNGDQIFPGQVIRIP